mmetsp:Transcript_38479/g.60046  ORF Transcript_38479/g.60046 Transcript_38479/m.60046 type:complete len:357 (+) Transcript_38479:780-1850(+)
MRIDNENPWKRQIEKGANSSTVVSDISYSRKLAFYMGAHSRLGAESPVRVITDDDLMDMIMRHCTITIHRKAPPPRPDRDHMFQLESPLDITARCFPGGRTAEEFMNQSSSHFPGACGGTGGKPCIGFKVTKVTRIQNSSLWRPYHWRKQCITEKLPEMETLRASCHLASYPLSSGPAIDPAANEFYAFHGQSAASIENMKDAGISQEIGHPSSLFGGGIYFSPSAFRANMSVPCSRCDGGTIGRRECSCSVTSAAEHTMVIARVTLGDAHICTEYDGVTYKGEIHRPRRRPPLSEETGHVNDSIIGESIENGGTHLTYRELVVYDRFQCYPEFVVNYQRLVDVDPAALTACYGSA